VQPKRLQLIHYDVCRELCDKCRKETFHFVPIGTAPEMRLCGKCGNANRPADMTETSVFRLVTRDDGEVVIVPCAG
jgi:NMD protein affecting ribosome stability and mRNA decay